MVGAVTAGRRLSLALGPLVGQGLGQGLGNARDLGRLRAKPFPQHPFPPHVIGPQARC